MAQLQTSWNIDTQVLLTELHGSVTVQDVQHWRDSLNSALGAFIDGQLFKLIVDMTGYQFYELVAHHAMRRVIPETLCRHGFQTRLFEITDTPSPTLKAQRGITCVAVAHVHHDEHKMNSYDDQLGCSTERFFHQIENGMAWAASAPMPRNLH